MYWCLLTALFCCFTSSLAQSKLSWGLSENLTKWYTPLDLCILNNDSKDNIDAIIQSCQQQTGISSAVQPHRCTVGNAWRGPAKAPFCASEDIPYAHRTHFKNALSGFDDPSQTPLKDFFSKLSKKNGALLLIGDSVQQQFMGAIACELEREQVWKDPKQFWNTDEVKTVSVDASVDRAVPIKFAAVYHLVNGRYDKMPNASMHTLKSAVTAFVEKHDAVVVVVNMGLHYVFSPLVTHFSRADYISQMSIVLTYLNGVAQEQKLLGKDVIVLFRETTAQHFATPNGYWPGSKFASTMSIGCQPIQDPSPEGDWRNTDVKALIKSKNLQFIRILPFYELSVPLWNLHVNGHLRDCTHLCWSPLLYQSFFHFLNSI